MSLFTPAAQPRFGDAARCLVLTLQQQPRIEDRSGTLRELCRELGDAWYPYVLKLLMVIGEGAPESARAVVAQTVAHGLERGLPAAGTLGSWGAPAPLWAVVAQARPGFLRMASSRPLDPLSYVVAWHGQASSRPLLPRAAFERALLALLRLMDACPRAAEVYRAYLRASVATASDGTFSTLTLERLQLLVDAWSAGASAEQIAAAMARAGDQAARPVVGGVFFSQRFV
jgi:hypothetical protein